MGQKAEYRSAVRSRRMLREAYVELMTERPLEKITVTDIVSRAGLNRGTFYAHFANPEALREQMEAEFIEELFKLFNNFPYEQLLQNPLPLLLELARFLEQDADFYRKLILSKGSGTFLQKIRELFIQRLMQESEKLPAPADPEALRVHIRFFAGGMVSICQDWFADKTGKSLEEMFQLVTPSIVSGMAGYLVQPPEQEEGSP